VIHPSHVKIVNVVFQPSEQDVAHYEGLIAALEEGLAWSLDLWAHQRDVTLDFSRARQADGTNAPCAGV